MDEISESKRGIKFNKLTNIDIVLIIVIVVGLFVIAIAGFMLFKKLNSDSAKSVDLKTAKTLIENYKTTNGKYPADLSCTSSLCIKPADGTSFVYQVDNTDGATAFTLYADTGSSISRISNVSDEKSVSKVCPINFIVVPGRQKYGTSDFCVMKYEAKKDAVTGQAVSRATGLPWAMISQDDAISQSENVTDCQGCHLISEAEWMTLAVDVLSVPSNWDSGVVGKGHVYNGHNKATPAMPIAASLDDTDGYSGLDDKTKLDQRRTLTLSNGEVIWDLAGNVWEFIDATVQANQPGVIGKGSDYYDWKDVNTAGSLSVSPLLSNIDVPGASDWSSATTGIGYFIGDASNKDLKAVIRGGDCANKDGVIDYEGVLSMSTYYKPSDTYRRLGFRVAE